MLPPAAQMFLESLVVQITTRHSINSGLIVSEQGLLSDEFMERVGETPFAWNPSANFDPKTCGPTSLLLGVSPWGHDLPIRQHLLEIAEWTTCLTPDGWAVLLIPGFHHAFRMFNFDEMLRRNNLALHAIINVPARFLGNGLRPIVVLVSPRSSEKVHLLDSERSYEVDLGNFLQGRDSEDIGTGIWLRLSDFTSFEHWRVQKDIAALEGDYGSFNRWALNDVAYIAATPSGTEFEDIPGCVYLPTIGNGPAVSELSATTMKHQNYFQLIVNPEIATPQYLCAYFNSRHFRLYLEAEKNSRSLTIPKLSKRQAQTLPVSAPSLETQEIITLNLSKLMRLREMVDELSQLISVNPLANAQIQQIDEALSVFGRLTQEERIVSLIREGESNTLEFKETFSLNGHTPNKDKVLEEEVIRATAGFLNTDGGTVLVGEPSLDFPRRYADFTAGARISSSSTSEISFPTRLDLRFSPSSIGAL